MEVNMPEQIEPATSPDPITTSDERTMAALAHGSVIFSFFGPIIPALIWAFQRRKSPYAAFHALQAMGYQMLTFWVGIAAYLLFVLLITLLIVPLAALAESGSKGFEMAPFALQGSMMFFMFGFMGLYFLIGIVGAVLCLTGKDFKYPLLGKRLEKYLGRGPNLNDPLDETKEEQWMAGMCHASAILFLWGALLPLLTWVLQKDSSSKLRFQSLQALVYQFIAVVGYSGFMAIYMVVFMGMFAGLIFFPTLVNGDGGNSAMLIILIVFLVVMLLLMLFISLALPTYHLFAMIAGIQVVKGRDYHYPLLGKFLARKFGNS
jgi:uncharacterized Tic20 family protein